MTDTPIEDPIEAVILQLVQAAPIGRSIAPTDAARTLDPDHWPKRHGHIRQAAIRLAQRGEVVILRKGKPVEDSTNFKGVYRIGRP
jgi:hypothetical protein